MLNPIQLYSNLIQNPKTKWIVVVLTLVYIFSPIDFIPEFIFPFGILDDGALLALMISQLVLGTKKK